MNTATNTHQFEILNDTSRAIRLTLAAVFIGITLSVTGTMGIFVVIPLYAIYLFATGLTGWAPVKELFHHQRPGAKKLSTGLRVSYATLGTALISSIFLTTVAPLGWMVTLPLLAVYPFFGAITGFDALDVLNNTGKTQDDETKEENLADVHYFTDDLMEKIAQYRAAHHHDRAA